MKRIGVAVWACFVLPSLPALAFESDYKPYIQCLEEQEAEDADSCLDRVGRSEQPPSRRSYGCILNKQILEFADRNNAKLSWEVFFMNEHCRITDRPHYKKTGQGG